MYSLSDIQAMNAAAAEKQRADGTGSHPTKHVADNPLEIAYQRLRKLEETDYYAAEDMLKETGKIASIVRQVAIEQHSWEQQMETAAQRTLRATQAFVDADTERQTVEMSRNRWRMATGFVLGVLLVVAAVLL